MPNLRACFFFPLFFFFAAGFQVNRQRVNASTNMPGQEGILKIVFLKKKDLCPACLHLMCQSFQKHTYRNSIQSMGKKRCITVMMDGHHANMTGQNHYKLKAPLPHHESETAGEAINQGALQLPLTPRGPARLGREMGESENLWASSTCSHSIASGEPDSTEASTDSSSSLDSLKRDTHSI